MNEHSLDAQCHICRRKFETKTQFREHYELEHAHDAVKCIFCKSTFENPLDMDTQRWEEVHSHIYGEILYSRLAEYEEKNVG
uniref:C2H2-type domain-containing protein n=1 Tax=Caenorhabditis japonica TaxID=281687 RepID=A0A8R1EDR6_CAEJA